MDGYLRKEAHEITGISASSIQLYTDRGLLTPDVEDPKGKGFARRYSKMNLVELRVIRALARKGVTLKTIGEIIKRIRQSSGDSRYFDPEELHLTRGKVYLVVYDHDRPEKMRVRSSWHLDPDKPDFKMEDFTEEQIEEIRTGKHKPIVDMEDRKGAIVVDVSALWEDVAGKV